jgi:hypothetical protein
MIKKYRKKPIPVDCMQLTPETLNEVKKFVGDKFIHEGTSYPRFYILTLEGKLETTFGSYIVKGIEGEFWAVKQSIFEKTYEEIDEG